MLSSRLVRLISEHWAEITDRIVRRIRRDAKLLETGRLPEAELRERSREILQNLDTWFVSKEDELAARYEQLGRIRFEQGVPLHEIVHTLQVVKENMIQYVRDQGMDHSALTIYAEEEFERSADRIFAAMIYYVVRGYEAATPARARAASGFTAGGRS